MKPPYCRICMEPLDDISGGLLYFKKRPSDEEWDRRVREEGIVGHPPYCDYFCAKHVSLARSLTHLPIDEALNKMRNSMEK